MEAYRRSLLPESEEFGRSFFSFVFPWVYRGSFHSVLRVSVYLKSPGLNESQVTLWHSKTVIAP